MTEERRKEIALLIIEQIAIDRGIPGADVMKRDVGNQAYKLGLETEELMAFYQTFTAKVLGRVFGFDKVSLQMSEPRK